MIFVEADNPPFPVRERGIRMFVNNFIVIYSTALTARCTALQPCNFIFEFLHPFLQAFHKRSDLALRETFVDVLGAVCIPGLDGKQYGPFHLAWVGRVSEAFEQARVIFDNTGRAPVLVR
jgi:hypothetical protein